MVWRSILCLLIWLGVITLLLFPRLCAGWKFCEPTPIPLVITLAMLGAGVALSDTRLIAVGARAMQRKRPRGGAPDGSDDLP